MQQTVRTALIMWTGKDTSLGVVDHYAHRLAALAGHTAWVAGWHGPDWPAVLVSIRAWPHVAERSTLQYLSA